MPSVPLRPCSYPGCPELVSSGRCPRHRRETNRRRGSARSRGYDRAWETARLRYLAEHPLCEIAVKCKDRPLPQRLASIVDHIVPIRQGGARLDPANFQSACRACHSWKTVVVDGALRT